MALIKQVAIYPFGLMAFLLDLFFRAVRSSALGIEHRLQERAHAKRDAWLKTLDADRIAESGALEDVILAQQARCAQGLGPKNYSHLRRAS
ncbi:hypothetical protein JZX86_05880 [Agrobacterium rosae]|uniref:hypothetical protein n=1 Tax=Agrobacterium rosae TaxID=1972867 RepID=UPI0019D3BF9F|nr:hypothetical protein [Agrobacterium rosae]MBN7804893.1 hypothetical protein [Agrobacterium rosae]